MGNNGALAIGQMRIALAQINPTLGDLSGNSDLICEYAAKANAAGANILLFPEMIITVSVVIRSPR
jgi:NAD+ synthase (glutamine-hydrolysing)